MASIVCSRFGVDTSLRSADYAARWIDDLAAFRTGMTVIHDAAAELIEAVTAILASSAPLALAA